MSGVMKRLGAGAIAGGVFALVVWVIVEFGWRLLHMGG